MSAKIEMSSQIQANRSMNQKIDRMMSQKFMTGSRLEAGAVAPCGSSALPKPGPDLSPSRGDRAACPLPPIWHRSSRRDCPRSSSGAEEVVCSACPVRVTGPGL
jgi:hypothetical protein